MPMTKARQKVDIEGKVKAVAKPKEILALRDSELKASRSASRGEDTCQS
jgi:hypothetical protein